MQWCLLSWHLHWGLTEHIKACVYGSWGGVVRLVTGASVAGQYLLSCAVMTNSQCKLHVSLPLAPLPRTLSRYEGLVQLSLWLAQEIRIHQNCPVKKTIIAFIACIEFYPNMRCMGLRHQGRSTTPNISSLENAEWFVSFNKISDPFLKLIGSTMPQTGLLYLGHFSTSYFPGHSPIMPRELGKCAGSS